VAAVDSAVRSLEARSASTGAAPTSRAGQHFACFARLALSRRSIGARETVACAWRYAGGVCLLETPETLEVVVLTVEAVHGIARSDHFVRVGRIHSIAQRSRQDALNSKTVYLEVEA